MDLEELRRKHKDLNGGEHIKSKQSQKSLISKSKHSAQEIPKMKGTGHDGQKIHSTPTEQSSEHRRVIEKKHFPKLRTSLKKGKKENKPEDVKLLQSSLNAIYPYSGVEIDGVYSSQTEHTVILYQETHHIVPDGFVNEPLWEAILSQIQFFTFSYICYSNGRAY